MSSRPTVGVIGASGFIGSRLVEWLILRNLADVRPFVRAYKSMAGLARFDLDFAIVDATDPVGLEPKIKGCEFLFHCVVGNRDTILQSAESVYRAAARSGVRRLVYLSSAVVHGNDPASGTSEESPLLDDQPFEYNVSRVMAENLLRRLRADGAVEVVVLRPLIVYGPRSTLWTARIATDLLSGTAYLVECGAGICNTVYVDNLIQAMWSAALSEKAVNQDLIVTDGERVTWRDLYSAVAEAVEVDISQVYNVDSDRLQNLLHPRKVNPWREVLSLAGHTAKQALPPVAITVAKRTLPGSLKNVLRQRWDAVNGPPHNSDATGNGTRRFPAIDSQIASLQACRYLLPITKAQSLLGYKPQVSFTEGCRRTREWIRFAFGIGTPAQFSCHYRSGL